MDAIGTIYRLGSVMSQRDLYSERQFLKRALTEEGFSWQESSAHNNLEIHDGGDILCGDRYKVGEVIDNKVLVFDSSRLEDFLEAYKW
ncbi:hypothetical protein HOB85_05170 [Candidatus Woesearchaeota archaeon]|nr:hypothetical protein [Candidatus Woesearchaeota archaeon]